MERELIRYIPSASAVVGDNIYFTDLYTNALFRFNMKEKRSICVAQFDDEPCRKKELYTDIVVGNDVLCCVPHSAKTIGLYYLNTKTTESIKLPEELQKEEVTFKCGCICGEELFLFGYNVEGIWHVNIKEKCIRKFLCNVDCDNSGKFFLACMNSGEKIYAVCREENVIWELNIYAPYIKKITLDEKKNWGFAGIVRWGEYLLLNSCKEHNVSIYNLIENAVVYKLDVEMASEEWPFAGGVVNDEGVVYFPVAKEDTILSIDIKNKWEELQKIRLQKVNDTMLPWGNPVICDGKVVIWKYQSNFLFMYDYKLNKFETVDLISETTPKLNGLYLSGRVVQEGEYSLLEFIENLL